MHPPSSPTVIYAARKILTMNPAQPEATHAAVRDGRILGVGSLDELRTWGPAELDERYADQVLMPGLVEGHCHLHEGGIWQFVYVGYYPRRGPDGRVWEGLKSLDAVTQRLREAQTGLDADTILIGWGFDPIFFGGERMDVRHLDAVSRQRPIAIMHTSMHLMNVNTPMLARVGIDRDTDIEGITRFPNGEPSGELCEFAAMFPVMRVIGNPFRTLGLSEEGLRMFGKVAQWAGVTTATDLVNELADDGLQTLARITGEADYPVRIVPAASALTYADDPSRCLDILTKVKQLNHDKLHLGMVKLVVDGSIQGFTARLRWPGYHNGAPNGIWIIAPDALPQVVQTYHDTGVQLHIHTNGDEATQAAIDAVPPYLAALPDGRRRAVSPHGEPGHVRQPVHQPHFLLGRCALRTNHGAGSRPPHGCVRLGHARGCALRHSFGCARHAAGALVHRVVRGAAPNCVGSDAGRVRAHQRGRRATRHHAGGCVYPASGSSDRFDRGR